MMRPVELRMPPLSGPSIHRQLADWLRSARCAVALTGAGISTESGLPDFRSPGGVWATSRQIQYDEFMASAEARIEYWRQKAITHHQFVAAAPNAGHQALARWEQQGLLSAVITQNIDGLHQLAGSTQVLELHGTARQVQCQDCGALFDAGPWVAYFEQHQKVGQCDRCGGARLKHATVSFGQSLPADVLQQAVDWCRRADLLLALGSSLVVHPAASLPEIAARRGARLVIINHTATPLDSWATVTLRSSIGETLVAIDQQLAADAGSLDQ